MKELRVLLDTMSKIQAFVNAASKHTGEITIYSGKYVVNGKSLVGIISLDLSKPVKVEIDGDISKDIRNEIDPLVVA